MHLFLKVEEPFVSTDRALIEDFVIPQLPDFPGGYQKNLHKEQMNIVNLAKNDFCMNIMVISPMNVQSLPAGLGKRIVKEEEIYIFLNAKAAHYTIIAIVKMVMSPS